MQKETKEQCEYNTQAVGDYARTFPRGHCLSWGLDQKKSGTEPVLTTEMEPGIEWQNKRWQFFRSDHPIFRASSAFERGELRSKGGRKKSIHFNGSTETIELLIRTVIAANQLSIYGAVADLCDEVPKRVRASRKLAAPKHLEKVEIPAVFSKAEKFYQ